VWDYVGEDHDEDGKLSFDERINRSCSQPAIADDLLFLSDHSGMLHCMDAATGKYHWNYDLFASTWVSAPLIVDQKVYVCDEDGDVAVFELSSTRKFLAENSMDNSVYSSPAVAGNTLYISRKDRLFAIESSQAP
jgi:outer membrane protein assembly factor BamB